MGQPTTLRLEFKPALEEETYAWYNVSLAKKRCLRRIYYYYSANKVSKCLLNLPLYIQRLVQISVYITYF